MLSLPNPRQSPPILARGRMGLRLHVRPNAFGNALGSAIAGPNVDSQEYREAVRNGDIDPVTTSPFRMSEQALPVLELEDLGPLDFGDKARELMGILPTIRTDSSENELATLNLDGDSAPPSRFGWLKPQKINGVQVKPPSDAEIFATSKRYDDHYGRHDVLDGFEQSKAFHDGRISIKREGNVVTLEASGLVAGYRADSYIKNVSDVLGNRSFIDSDGTIYRTAISLRVAGPKDPADILLQYDLTGDRANADCRTGIVHYPKQLGMNQKELTDAHEFMHVYFGLKDAYRSFPIRMENDYIVPAGVPYSGFENSILADDRRGKLELRDLKPLILKLEQLQKMKKK